MENVRLLTNDEKPPSCYEKMGTSMGFKQLTTGNISWTELFWNLWIEEDTFFTVPVKTYLDLEIIQRYNEKRLLLSFANVLSNKHSTAQVIKFSIKDFCSKCDQIRSYFGHIYWRNPKWKTSFFVPCSMLFGIFTMVDWEHHSIWSNFENFEVLL